MGLLFKRTSALSAFVLGALALAGPASAATYFNYNTNVGGDFGNADPTPYPPLFNDSYSFLTTYARTATIELNSSYQPQLDNGTPRPLDYNVNFVFNGVKINGTVIPATQTGVTEQRYLANFRIPAGLQTIGVQGSSGVNGAYTGMLTLSGVPETSTWAMMVLGVGFAGGALRSRRRETARVAVA